MLSVQTFTFNAFEENTYLLYDETGEAVVIDPGCSNREEEKELTDFVKAKGLQVKLLLNTHCHVDHVLGNAFVKKSFQVPLLIHAKDESTLRAVKVYAPMYGFATYHEALPDRFLKEGEVLHFGNQQMKILFLPGHAPGHVGFYHEEAACIISGDVLFNRSIGRTDLPGGHFETLINSIQRELFTLPDNVTVFPGHGPTTTIGEEKVENPFCAVSIR